jgi:uncharacterized protein YgiB involved in biofilm formation
MKYRWIHLVLLLACVLLLALPALAAYSGPCPIGTNNAPNLIDPGIASGAKCRGACGQDCPPDRCEPLKDASGNAQSLTVVIQNPRGVCTYNNVIECPMHPGCVQHDACFDVCAEGGQNSMTDKCHMHCNVDCVQQYGFTNCVRWADAPTLVYQNQAASYTGWIMDQASGVDFAGYYFYSDPPEFKAVTLTPTKTPTPTQTTYLPTTILTTPPTPTLVPETTVTYTVATTGTPDYSTTEPPMSVQRDKCAAAGGKWDYFSEGCVIGPATPTLGIPDLFKNKPTIQFTPDDFKAAADDAMKNGQYDLAVTYLEAAEDSILKGSPDKSSRTAEADRSLAALETAKAAAYHNMNGHGDEEEAAQLNARTLNADASTKEKPFDLPGFEAVAGIMALCLLFVYRRGSQ